LGWSFFVPWKSSLKTIGIVMISNWKASWQIKSQLSYSMRGIQYIILYQGCRAGASILMYGKKFGNRLIDNSLFILNSVHSSSIHEIITSVLRGDSISDNI